MIPRYYTSKSPVSYLDTPFERGIRNLLSLPGYEWLVNLNLILTNRGIIFLNLLN